MKLRMRQLFETNILGSFNTRRIIFFSHHSLFWQVMWKDRWGRHLKKLYLKTEENNIKIKNL